MELFDFPDSNVYSYLLFCFTARHETAADFTDGFLDMACLRGVENISEPDGVYLHRCFQHTKGEYRKAN